MDFFGYLLVDNIGYICDVRVSSARIDGETRWEESYHELPRVMFFVGDKWLHTHQYL